jgi:hypothetical protein
MVGRNVCYLSHDALNFYHRSLAMPLASHCRAQLAPSDEGGPIAPAEPPTPNIQPSTCANARSCGVRSGLRKVTRLPLRSACDSQAAMLKASC